MASARQELKDISKAIGVAIRISEESYVKESRPSACSSSPHEASPERGRGACAVRKGSRRGRARPQALNYRHPLIQWTANRRASPAQDVDEDHRGLHVLVARQFLRSARGCDAAVVVVVLP